MLNIQLENAYLLEADINYTIIHYTCGKKITISYNLKKAAEVLDLSESFIRIHRRYIVNRAYIKATTAKPNQTVILHNGLKLSVARRRVV